MADERFKICSVCQEQQRKEIMMFMDEDSICLACAISIAQKLDENERELYELKEYDDDAISGIRSTSKGKLYYLDSDYDNVFHIV